MPILDELQERKAWLELQRDVATLEAEVQAANMAGSVVLREDGWGDFVRRDDYLRDGKGLSNFGDLSLEAHISRPQDHKRGDNAPIWRTETEHASLRGMARMIANTDEVGGAAIRTLTNYCVGTQGLTYDATLKKGTPKTEDTLALAACAQDIVDRFVEKASWSRDGEREVFHNSHRDGEQYLALYPDGLIPRLRIIDPSFFTEPDTPRRLEDFLGIARGNSDTLDWKYGHGAPWNDSSHTDWAFVSWYGDPLEWEAIPARRLVHLKLNVDRDVKRGLTAYYPVYKNLQNAEKLLSNTVQGAAIQAAIAYIREHAPGVRPGQIDNFRGGMATDTVTRNSASGTTRTAYGRKLQPGTVIDGVAGAKIHAGPLGTARGQNYINILQAALRIAGIRWQMPEYMISGDASNNNLASILAAESPFTKSAEAEQAFYCRAMVELLWKVLGMAYEAGSFPCSPRKAKRLISLTCTGPAIAVRDRKESHEIRKEEYEAGILSLETWAAEADRNLADEVEKGAEPQPTPVAGDWGK